MRALPFVILSVVLSVGVAFAFDDSVPGIALGLGLLLGFAGSVLRGPGPSSRARGPQGCRDR